MTKNIKSPLTELETDLLEDMSHDSYFLWEIYQYVRLHYPDADEIQVLEIGNDLLKRWVENKYISAYYQNDPLQHKIIDAEIIAITNRYGIKVMDPALLTIRLQLTKTALDNLSGRTQNDTTSSG